RHPNLVALELSSFKCGHDAPIYTVVEEIVEHSGTPYFCFKDIDENKPTGSIRIRVETISYFLKRYREDMIANKGKEKSIEEKLAEFERKLRLELMQEYVAPETFDRGHKETIHVTLDNLIATAQPQSRPQELVAGD
ncbi:MAG TPA: CoA activase, partial [Bryobacterales bacterium]|nr:CoA activase [Bryobacterales bacterium]